eukprot:15432523-Alexandrium_andersonii.AAC.1
MCIRDSPSRASGTSFEAVSGPVQFKLRTPGAILHFTHGGLQIEADCSTDGPWAYCGLHCGCPSM